MRRFKSVEVSKSLTQTTQLFNQKIANLIIPPIFAYSDKYAIIL